VTRAVLDASAILTLLHEEPGASEVTPWIANGVVSAVNLAEVVGKLLEAGMPERSAISAIEALALDVVAFDAAMAVRAGTLRPTTRSLGLSLGLSLGDRGCLATAQELELPVITADRTWRELEIGVPIHVVR
jgi:PIN domain nuclease of toxin-antitoxin system